MKKTHSSAFKFKVALEALRGDQTIQALCQAYNLHPSQVHKWKRHLREQGQEVFKDMRPRADQEAKEKATLYEKIGQLNVEVDYLKKTLGRA